MSNTLNKHVNNKFKKGELLMNQTFVSGRVGKNKNGEYYFSYRIKDENGLIKQRKKEHKNWRKKDAENALDEMKESLKNQPSAITNDGAMTINQVFEKLIQEKSNDLKPKSIRNYISTYNVHLKVEWGELKLKEINRQKIVDWQTKILNENYRNEINNSKDKNENTNSKNKNEKYKNANLEKIQEQFKTILNFAVDCQYIEFSPWPVKLRLAKNALEIPDDIKVWTYDEFLRFIAEIEDITLRTFYLCAYHCGFRLNECLGLLVSDLNFEKNTIRISKQYYSKEKTYGPPKSKNSIRTIHMNEITRNSLKRLIEENKKSIYYHDESIVFGINKHLAPKTIENRYKKVIKDTGLNHIKLHGLRHSHVSLLINMNISAFEIAERIGDTVDMVYKVYGHMFDKTKAETMKKMDVYLESNQTDSKEN